MDPNSFTDEFVGGMIHKHLHQSTGNEHSQWKKPCGNDQKNREKGWRKIIHPHQVECVEIIFFLFFSFQQT